MRLAGIFLAVLSTPALALPPAGVNRADPEHLWWECHVKPTTRLPCCREADGHVLGDNDWRIIEKPNGVRAYQVRVEAKWYDVPAQAVIHDLRHCGPEPNPAHRAMAKVWYDPSLVNNEIVDIKIYCFIASTMY
jgi:hypothetical protein